MIVALLGLLISFASVGIAFPTTGRRRMELFAAVLAMHLAATGAYWFLAADAGYDALFYYRDPLNWASQAVQPGSVAVIQFVQGLRAVLGGSFFAYFLFFQAFGMIGFALLMRSFGEIADSLGLVTPIPVYGLLLLPGMHLWTVAIGKDAPLFMAVSLSVWASMRLPQRLVWMALAVLVIGLIRPPVAVLVVVASAASLVFDRRLKMAAKLVIGLVSVAGAAMVLSAAQNQLEISTLDAQGVVDFVERNQTLGQKVSGGADIVNLPYPLKLLSLLFRPLFFDADGVLGLIASVENLLLLIVFGYLAVHIRTVAKLMTTVYHFSYSVLFSSMLFATLALLNYNVGLGLRQKVMGMPAVLIIVVSLFLFRRYQTHTGALRFEDAKLQTSSS